MKTAIVILLCFFGFVFCGSNQLSNEYQLEWSVVNDRIYFNLTSGRLSWLAIGFHPVNSSDVDLTNADVIVIAFENGVPSAHDLYSINGEPTPDTCLGGKNNIENVAGTQEGGVTRVSFSRLIYSNDSYDFSLSQGNTPVVWAIGYSNLFNVHGFKASQIGQTVVDFFSEEPQPATCTNPFPDAWVPSGFCATRWATGLNRPRGMVRASNGDVLVVEAGQSRIVSFFTQNGALQRANIASAAGLNHGIAVHGNYLYATSATTLYRWPYNGQRTNLGTAQIVVKDIPCCHHQTRTPVFDSQGLVYISVGSASNVDPNSLHARINRFNISVIPSGGISWNTGFVFADGLRNEVGLDFDSNGTLWGVENGVDNLNRPDLGGDIHNLNPSEELNHFPNPGGKFYGYPFCWSEYELPRNGTGRGTQWAQPEFMNDGIHTDKWCNNTDNVVRPAFNLQPHSAPLDIKFYNGTAFPSVYKNGAFVTLHGSWNRTPPNGYRVIHVEFQNGRPVNNTDFFKYNGTAQNWPTNVRPVALTFIPCGTTECLLVTSDASGEIISLRYLN